MQPDAQGASDAAQEPTAALVLSRPHASHGSEGPLDQGPQAQHRRTHQGESTWFWPPPPEDLTAHLVILLQVLKKASFMPDSGISISLSQTMHLLDETERSSYSEWSQNLDAQYLQRLEQPLIMRCRDNQAKLDINFDR